MERSKIPFDRTKNRKPYRVKVTFILNAHRFDTTKNRTYNVACILNAPRFDRTKKRRTYKVAYFAS